jgi:hypothetical protein
MLRAGLTTIDIGITVGGASAQPGVLAALVSLVCARRRTTFSASVATGITTRSGDRAAWKLCSRAGKPALDVRARPQPGNG